MAKRANPSVRKPKPAAASPVDWPGVKAGEVLNFSSGKLSSKVLFVAGPDSGGMVVFDRGGRFGLASSKCFGLVIPEPSATPAA